jgi:hypothetical protein|tara:strand:+ start:273 stop:551 length:279 start_codon:yes stop_codon:yes gene_type:complete
MKKLEFNNLDLILDYIKNPEHKNVLFLLECAIREAKTSSKSEFKVGDHVVFGRPNGRKRPGVIVTLNPKKAVIKDTNLGGKWRVPYSMLEAA